jgi:hypothetical protein
MEAPEGSARTQDLDNAPRECAFARFLHDEGLRKVDSSSREDQEQDRPRARNRLGGKHDPDGSDGAPEQKKRNHDGSGCGVLRADARRGAT